MEVKVNIINTRYMPMSEAVTVPSLMMMTSTVSEESLARDTHTDSGSYTLKFATSHDFASKKCSYFKLLCVLIYFLNAGSHLSFSF